MSQDAQSEIITKVTEWKKLFQVGIEEATGVHIDKPEELSYVELLSKANTPDFSSGNAYMTYQHCVRKLGGFSREAQNILATPGYCEAKNLAVYVVENYDENMFEEQAKAGPIIATPPHLPEQKFGMIFHYPYLPILEIVYESKDADELARPDVFVMAGAICCSIKAIPDLAEKPILKSSLDALKLG